MEKQWKTTTVKAGGITATVLQEISESETIQQIADLAHKLWEERGCPEGTPEEDWFRAEQQITKSPRVRAASS